MFVWSVNRKLTLITDRPDTTADWFCNILNAYKKEKLLTASNFGAWVMNESKYITVKFNRVKRILFIYYM